MKLKLFDFFEIYGNLILMHTLAGKLSQIESGVDPSSFTPLRNKHGP